MWESIRRWLYVSVLNPTSENTLQLSEWKILKLFSMSALENTRSIAGTPTVANQIQI